MAEGKTSKEAIRPLTQISERSTGTFSPTGCERQTAKPARIRDDKWERLISSVTGSIY